MDEVLLSGFLAAMVRVSTPLLLAIGDKDTRLPDTTRFYEALRAAGAPATLVTYPGDGHELSRASTEDYMRRTLSLFRSAMKPDLD